MLAAGAKLGPYEILSAIGAGGMGEVYKARDSRLDRIVAIKILPEALAEDPQFRERFDREARAISQLTHPGAPAALFALRFASGTSITVGTFGGRPQYAVARDGRFLVNVAVDAEATPPIAIVLNWDAQFRK